MTAENVDASGAQLGAEAEEHVLLALDRSCHPADVAIRARRALEALLRLVYAAKVRPIHPLAKPLDIEALLHPSDVSATIGPVRPCVEYLRNVGNQGAHAGHKKPSAWSSEDAVLIRSHLRSVTRWCFVQALDVPMPQDVRRRVEEHELRLPPETAPPPAAPVHEPRPAEPVAALGKWTQVLATAGPEADIQQRHIVLEARRRIVELESDDDRRFQTLLYDELAMDVRSAGMFAVVGALRGTLGKEDWLELSQASEDEAWRLLCALLDDFASRRAPVAARAVAELSVSVNERQDP